VKVVNINYGVPFDMFLKVNDEKDVAIAKRDATIAEKDAVITKLIEENKEREKLSNLETKKSINNEVDKTTLKERLIGIGTSLNTVTNKDNISQILLEQKKVEKLNSFDDWYENGAGEFNNGNYPAAITSFTKALETVQNEASKAYTYNYRGTAYFKLRKFEKSLADYNKAIDLKILGHELPYYNKGIINYICLGQYEEAKINLNKSIVANPKHIDSYLFLSAINIIEGDYESALDTVDKSFSSRNKAYSFQLKTEDAAMLFYIKCLAMKLLNKDTSYSETELNKILKTDFIISRKFDFFTSWLKDADFNNKTMAFIKNKNELFKQKQQTSYP
jgi:tetratricopeptide (TPR) repeat protein